MQVLLRWQAGAFDLPADPSVMDWVLLLFAAGLTLLVAAVAFRAAARSNERPPIGPPEGFTMARSASWLQTLAVVALGLSALLLLWYVVLIVVRMG